MATPDHQHTTTIRFRINRVNGQPIRNENEPQPNENENENENGSTPVVIEETSSTRPPVSNGSRPMQRLMPMRRPSPMPRPHRPQRPMQRPPRFHPRNHPSQPDTPATTNGNGDGDGNGNGTQSLTYPSRIRFNPQMIPHQSLSLQPPQLLPSLQEQPHNTNNSPSHDIAELECGICYEIINDPSYCGSCTSRYCHHCLQRAIDQSKTCPSCRKDISIAEIVRDDDFFTNFSNDTRSCIYPNCMQQLYPSEIRAHEENCDAKPMKCKYAPYGCQWNGPKKDLDAHYNLVAPCTGCSLHKLAPLIDELRQSKENHRQLVNGISARLVNERQASAHLRNQLLSLHYVHTDLLGMMQVIYVATCTPIKFLIKALIWRNFWNCAGLRGVVNNFICLVPLSVWVLKHFFRGFGYFSKLLDGPEEDVVHLYFMEMTLSFFTVALGGLFLACFVSKVSVLLSDSSLYFVSRMVRMLMLNYFST